MIRINLLLAKRRKKAQPLPPFLIHSSIIFAVALLAVLFFSFHLFGKISDLKTEKVTKEKKMSELSEKLKEVENYERDNALYKEKNEIIKMLKKKQKAPLVLLDEVSARLSKGVWLTSLLDKGGTIEINGYAFTNTELVSYVQNLKGSKALSDVTLLESKQEKMEHVFLYRFKLTFRVKV